MEEEKGQGEGGGYYHKILVKEILKRSVEKECFKTAAAEWKYVESVNGIEEECICTHPIVENCLIRNIHTEETCIVGNVCIDQFKSGNQELVKEAEVGRAELRAQRSLQERIRKLKAGELGKILVDCERCGEERFCTLEEIGIVCCDCRKAEIQRLFQEEKEQREAERKAQQELDDQGDDESKWSSAKWGVEIAKREREKLERQKERQKREEEERKEQERQEREKLETLRKKLKEKQAKAAEERQKLKAREDFERKIYPEAKIEQPSRGRRCESCGCSLHPMLERWKKKCLKCYKNSGKSAVPELRIEEGEVMKKCLDCGTNFTVKENEKDWRVRCFKCWKKSRS